MFWGDIKYEYCDRCAAGFTKGNSDACIEVDLVEDEEHSTNAEDGEAQDTTNAEGVETQGSTKIEDRETQDSNKTEDGQTVIEFILLYLLL